MRSIICKCMLLTCIFGALIRNGKTKETVEKVTESYGLTEGPHWDHRTQKLYFVDILNQNIHRLDTATGVITTAYIENGTVGVAVPVDDMVDKIVAGVGTNLMLVTWSGEHDEKNVPTTSLCSVDTDRKETRINDGKVDSAGRFWFGTMSHIIKGNIISPNQGSLYRVDNNLKPELMISPVTISNGLAWNSQDDTFYYIDSPTRQVAGYDYDPHNGTISNRRIIFDMNETNLEGIPDGMTIDTDDNLWIALYSGSHVIQVDPRTGTLLRKIEIPVKYVTSVAFGGPRLDILYVTTSSHSLTAEQRKATPQAGAVFAVKGLGVQGRLANSFVMD